MRLYTKGDDDNTLNDVINGRRKWYYDTRQCNQIDSSNNTCANVKIHQTPQGETINKRAKK